MADESDRVRAAREALRRAVAEEERAAAGLVPEVIERSWRRSIIHAVGSDSVSEDHRDVDPETTLYRAAAPVLDRWKEQLSDTPLTLFLSDRVGRIVARRLGTRDQASVLDEVHAAEGFVFSEEAMGTNGLGTALAENQAVLIAGSQHFNELLAPITCAAVPVAAPGGSVLGSVSLGGPVAEGGPLMLSLTAEIGRQIEQRLRTESRPEDLALAMSFMRYKNARRPTIVIDQRSLLANTPALPFVSVDSHVLLWELMRGHDWRTSATADIVLPSGTRVVGRQLDQSDEPRFVVHFFDPAVAGRTTQGDQARAGALELRHRSAPVRVDVALVEGPVGSGRFTQAVEVVSPGTMAEPVVAVAALDAQWADAAEAALSMSRDVVLRRVEGLTSTDFAALLELVRGHQRAVGRGERTSSLVLTFAPEQAERQLVELVAALGLPTTRIASLSRTPDRIPALVRSVLSDVDPSGRFIVTPSALQALMQHDWPGEVRELKRTLQDIVATAPTAVIDSRQLPTHLRRTASTRTLSLLETAERDAIVRALDLAGNNKKAAAELLGIGRTTLYRRLRQLRIQVDEASL